MNEARIVQELDDEGREFALYVLENELGWCKVAHFKSVGRAWKYCESEFPYSPINYEATNIFED